MRAADIALVRRSRLFINVTKVDLAAVLETTFVQTLPRNAIPCQQGEKPEFFHIILSGRVGLFVESPRNERLVEFSGPGDAFILPDIMLNAPYSLTARLLDEGRILLWPAAVLRAQVRGNAHLACNMTVLLSGYWRTLIGQIKDLTLLSAIERLSAFLLALAPRQTGAVTVTLPGGRRLVAGRLGITPQSLSRAFAELRPLGVSGSGRQVRITKPGYLRELVATRSLRQP